MMAGGELVAVDYDIAINVDRILQAAYCCEECRIDLNNDELCGEDYSLDVSPSTVADELRRALTGHAPEGDGKVWFISRNKADQARKLIRCVLCRCDDCESWIDDNETECRTALANS